jgi:uncharacterized protein (DUF2249 family)
MQDAGVVELDARGLEPPQPMVLILEALDSLPPDGEIRARTDRNPVHLHTLLAERGYASHTQPCPDHDHGFLTHIRRAS